MQKLQFEHRGGKHCRVMIAHLGSQCRKLGTGHNTLARWLMQQPEVYLMSG